MWKKDGDGRRCRIPKMHLGANGRKVVSTCLGCALILGTFAGVSRMLPKQEPIVIDESSIVTAGEAPMTDTKKKRISGGGQRGNPHRCIHRKGAV